MLTDEHYKWLKRIESGGVTMQEYYENRSVFSYLMRNKLISYDNPEYRVTEKGKVAEVDFEHSNYADALSAEAVHAAKLSNVIAEKSNKLSMVSIVISLLALMVSIVCVIAK